MEILFICLLGYGVVWLGKKVLTRIRTQRQIVADRFRQEQQAQAAFKQQQHDELARRADLREKNRLMQTALLQLEQAPDFYRTASFAAQAKQVPLAFRQQQFARFRPRILTHVIAQLRKRTETAVLRDSLEKLVAHLGMASFEADYLWEEAERQLERKESPRASFAEAITGLQQAHDQRMSVLRSLPGIEDELREQLLEAEEQRFRDQMLAQNEEPAQRHAERYEPI